MVDHEFIWAMLLVNDGSTHYGQSFFDLRLRDALPSFLLASKMNLR